MIGNCGCGHRVAFLPLNFGKKPTLLDHTAVCPDDIVNLDLDPNCSYSNWSPSNPDGQTLSTTTTYTVDISNNASGCTVNDNFGINVTNPGLDLSIPTELCYNQNIQITEEGFDNLFTSSTSPSQILVNGVLIANGDDVMNLPHVIGTPNYPPGVVTIEYIYSSNHYGLTCSKTYEIVIHPEISVDMQTNYEVCNNNFQPICATTNGLAQHGVIYTWIESGIIVGSGVCFTPSSYGTYNLIASSHTGIESLCQTRHSFTVYDPGVGINHLGNITFCSMVIEGYSEPRYIGWGSDPFGLIPYNFNWTHTDQDGTTTSISNTGAQYQVPYLGQGTYTAVVTANGCTETFNITVTDLLQIYNNNSSAIFGFTPLGGNQVSCQPATIISGTDIWTVVDQYGTTIPTTSYIGGVKFSYSTGVAYTVKLRRESYRNCKVYINEFTWMDSFSKNKISSRMNVANNSTIQTFVPTTISTFPNPTTGLVNIQLKDAETKETSIMVLNSLGQVILEKQVENDTNIEIDLSKEISGVYVLHIVNGATQFTEKVIKE